MTRDNDPNRQTWSRAVYAVTVVLSAFLLFQIQPMLAKVILPWFGGSSGVWTACMVFFQLALLLGYVYSHWSISRLKPRVHFALHGTLLAACALTLPISPSPEWRSSAGGDPTFRILALLAVNIGLPYFALASTSPLLQAWYARRFRAVPYRLFALSNVGSAVALVSYPVVVEPYLRLRTQMRMWSVLFAIFAAFCGAAAWMSFRSKEKLRADTDPGARSPGAKDMVVWASLAGCASILLLAVTNFLTRNVAPAPFLWIIPLFLYLLSFILCFDAERWYRRYIFLGALPSAIAAISYLLWTDAPKTELWLSISLCSAGLFVCSMVCHGELSRLRPMPSQLTAYFLSISAGGAVGGILVGLLIPQLFPTDVELHLGLVLCLTLAVLRLRSDAPPALAARRALLCGLYALPAILALFLGLALYRDISGASYLARNFYGSLRVNDATAQGYPYRQFIHGTTNHGEQWFDDELKRDPVTYFCRETGIGQVLDQSVGRPPWRVGIVGLGIGTLAAYARPGDTFRFYEINPLVEKVAWNWFSYLKESRARVEIVTGDGRLSLEREPAQNFHLLVLDAFSGDAIPVHLLTREAFLGYFRHLRPDGIMAIQTTNNYVNLAAMLDAAAPDLGLTLQMVEDEGDQFGLCYPTSWVILSRNGRKLSLRKAVAPIHSAGVSGWTDDYSNLLRILR